MIDMTMRKIYMYIDKLMKNLNDYEKGHLGISRLTSKDRLDSRAKRTPSAFAKRKKQGEDDDDKEN